jgi:hypothetical protein
MCGTCYTQQLLEKIVLGSSIKESLEWAAAPGNLPVSNSNSSNSIDILL